MMIDSILGVKYPLEVTNKSSKFATSMGLHPNKNMYTGSFRFCIPFQRQLPVGQPAEPAGPLVAANPLPSLTAPDYYSLQTILLTPIILDVPIILCTRGWTDLPTLTSDAYFQSMASKTALQSFHPLMSKCFS